MAHLLEHMAYVNAPPWHGLGQQLRPHQPIDVWIKQAGLDWQIQETPVRFMTDCVGSLSAIRSFPDNKVLYRSDTAAPLAVVGQRFKVVQPRDILEFYRDLTDVFGFELETAGVLKGGRKLWALARTGQSFTLKGRDVTQGYLLLATACDGTLATTAQFTSIRVVCHNTLAIALANGNGAVKVPHTTAFDAQAVKQQLSISVSAWDAFRYRMKLLSERPVTTGEAETFLHQVFKAPDKNAAEVTKSRAAKLAMGLYVGQGQGTELASANGTAYGLLNAVIQYVDHAKRAKSVDHRLDSAWFGAGAQLKQKALDYALLLLV